MVPRSLTLIMTFISNKAIFDFVATITLVFNKHILFSCALFVHCICLLKYYEAFLNLKSTHDRLRLFLSEVA